jgi:hypothetical protein
MTGAQRRLERSLDGQPLRTPGGVTVEADFTGAHLLHLAAAGCVLNDIYREAGSLGIELGGVRVTASEPEPASGGSVEGACSSAWHSCRSSLRHTLALEGAPGTTTPTPKLSPSDQWVILSRGDLRPIARQP